MARTGAHQLREVAGDSALAEGVKVIAGAHQTMIWDRQRHVLRLRPMLREYFPAALEVFEGVLGDLAAADALALLDRAPDLEAAARLSRAQIAAVLKRARRRDIDTNTAMIQSVLRALRQPAVHTASYAAGVRSLVAVIGVLSTQIGVLQGQVEADFGRHPAVEIRAAGRRPPERVARSYPCHLVG